MSGTGGRVAGKVALVTGGASGLGKASAEMFVKEGAKVAISDINDEGGRAVAAALGDAAIFIHHDVTSEEAWIEAIRTTVDTFGGINILVNSAGRGLGKTVEDIELQEWRDLHALDLDSVFLGCKHVLKPMAASGGGSIVNISSIYGLIGAPATAAYQASKGAVRLLTKSTAVDYAPFKIRVNSVHPGIIRTNMTKDLLGDADVAKQVLSATLIGRPAEPVEVSYAVLFLASDESSYMTGSEVVVDGGYTTM